MTGGSSTPKRRHRPPSMRLSFFSKAAKNFSDKAKRKVCKRTLHASYPTILQLCAAHTPSRIILATSLTSLDMPLTRTKPDQFWKRTRGSLNRWQRLLRQRNLIQKMQITKSEQQLLHFHLPLHERMARFSTAIPPITSINHPPKIRQLPSIVRTMQSKESHNPSLGCAKKMVLTVERTYNLEQALCL